MPVFGPGIALWAMQQVDATCVAGAGRPGADLPAAMDGEDEPKPLLGRVSTAEEEEEEDRPIEVRRSSHGMCMKMLVSPQTTVLLLLLFPRLLLLHYTACVWCSGCAY